VTSDSGSELASATLNAGKTFSHTFAATGTFSYHCTIHTYMVAKVVVLGAGVTAPPDGYGVERRANDAAVERRSARGALPCRGRRRDPRASSLPAVRMRTAVTASGGESRQHQPDEWRVPVNRPISRRPKISSKGGAP